MTKQELLERYNEMLLEIEFWARQESDEIFEFFNDLYHKLDEFRTDIEKLQ